MNHSDYHYGMSWNTNLFVCGVVCLVNRKITRCHMRGHLEQWGVMGSCMNCRTWLKCKKSPNWNHLLEWAMYKQANRVDFCCVFWKKKSLSHKSKNIFVSVLSSCSINIEEGNWRGKKVHVSWLAIVMQNDSIIKYYTVVHLANVLEVTYFIVQ